MPTNVKVINVFIASTNDLGSERNTIKCIAEELNITFADWNVQFKTWGWETFMTPGMHVHGTQGKIDEQCRSDGCDVVIGVLWKRLGTPTSTGETGTEHEINQAIAGWRRCQTPKVMVFFSKKAVPPGALEDAEQAVSLEMFKKRLPPEIVPMSYKSLKDFERQVRNALTSHLKEVSDLVPKGSGLDGAGNDGGAGENNRGRGSDAEREKNAVLCRGGSVTVVVGDRREPDPETPGDLFAKAPSTRDLTWLFSLGLPKDTVLWNDKIVSATTHESEIPSYLRERALLTLGSPVCNLMSRLGNKSACFPLKIDSALTDKIDRYETMIGGMERMAGDLEKLLNEIGDEEYKKMLYNLRGEGFLDPLLKNEKVGFGPDHNTDWASISFCRHPYSREHVAVLVSGLHLPGTMTATKLLADPDFFTDHPLGGVLKITIPDGLWYERLMRCTVKWNTPPYTMDDYLRKLKELETDKRFAQFDLDMMGQVALHHKHCDMRAFLKGLATMPAL